MIERNCLDKVTDLEKDEKHTFYPREKILIALLNDMLSESDRGDLTLPFHTTVRTVRYTAVQ